MKKLIAVILTLLLAFSFVACTDKPEEQTPNDKPFTDLNSPIDTPVVDIP